MAGFPRTVSDVDERHLLASGEVRGDWPNCVCGSTERLLLLRTTVDGWEESESPRHLLASRIQTRVGRRAGDLVRAAAAAAAAAAGLVVVSRGLLAGKWER